VHRRSIDVSPCWAAIPRKIRMQSGMVDLYIWQRYMVAFEEGII